VGEGISEHQVYGFARIARPAPVWWVAHLICLKAVCAVMQPMTNAIKRLSRDMRRLTFCWTFDRGKHALTPTPHEFMFST
jgi:hypothetical protein